MVKKTKGCWPVTNDKEFSKRFTLSIRNFMFVHVALTILADVGLIYFGYNPDPITTALTVMMPVYIALQGANYVKSGYENGKKIQSLANDQAEEADTLNG